MVEDSALVGSLVTAIGLQANWRDHVPETDKERAQYESGRRAWDKRPRAVNPRVTGEALTENPYPDLYWRSWAGTGAQHAAARRGDRGVVMVCGVVSPSFYYASPDLPYCKRCLVSLRRRDRKLDLGI